MTEEWGPWIQHGGRGCPCVGMYAQWIWHDGTLREGIAGMNRTNVRTMRSVPYAKKDGVPNSWVWSSKPSRRVIRYRIRKPRALQQLKELVDNTPQEKPKEVQDA